MRMRFGVLALVLVASLSACGDDDKTDANSEPSSTASVTSSDPVESLDPSDVDAEKCANFLAGKAKADELSSQLTPGANISEAIEAANEQFEALKEGAPEEIREALEAVQAAYTALGDFYKDPSSMTADAAAEMESSMKDLQENALKLNNWILENCS